MEGGRQLLCDVEKEELQQETSVQLWMVPGGGAKGPGRWRERGRHLREGRDQSDVQDV